MLKIIAVGDISLGDHYFNMGHGTASFIRENGLAKILDQVESTLRTGHIVFGNLETPLHDLHDNHSINFKEIAFCGPAKCARELAAAGFNVLNIANNHMLQHGEAVFLETVRLLKESNIFPLGMLGKEEFYSEPYRQVIEGKTIFFFGYSDVHEAFAPGAELYARFVREKVLLDVQKARAVADFVFVSLHFGVEGVDLPSSQAKEMAQWLIDSGVDMVFGHHPHVFQPVLEYRDGAIAYSMGDFIFDLFWEQRYLDSAMVAVEYDDSKQRSIVLHPTRFLPTYKVVPLSDRKNQKFMDEYKMKSGMFQRSTATELDGYISKQLKKLGWLGAFKKSVYFFKVFFKGNVSAKKYFITSKIPGLR